MGIRKPYFRFRKTHGVCPKCYVKLMKEIEAYKPRKGVINNES